MAWVAFVAFAAGAVWSFVVMAHDHQGAAVAFALCTFLADRMARITRL